MWQNAYSIQIWLCKWQGFCIGVFGMAYQVLDYALKQCAVNRVFIFQQQTAM
jgi:hypothetical protein